MKMCMGIAAVFILIFGFSTVNGFKNPPTLPEETIEGLKQIIMEKEDENRVLDRRMAIMEEEKREYEQQITQMKEDMEQQANIIEMQGKSISLFRPLLDSNPNMTDISCGCLPMAPPPTTLKPSRIDYQCEGQWNRSYSLECDRGVCGTNQFPSCDEPVLWENVDVSYEDCQQVSFNGTSHLCGQGWRQEKKTSAAIGAGLLTELVKTSCYDCGDISTALDWQPWGPCSDGEGNMDRPGRICRRRGNSKIGFQEEEAADDEVIFMAGWKSTEILDMSDSSSPCSRSTGILETLRIGHSLDYLDNTLIMCGGDGRGKPTSCVASNSGTGPWVPHSTTNRPRDRHASAVAGGKLHLFGGSITIYTDIYRYTDAEQSMETLEQSSKEWTLRLRLPYPMVSSCAVPLDLNTIIITGGMLHSYKKTASWHALDDKWDESLAELKTGRWDHGCGVITRNGETFVIVAGGRGSDRSYLTSSEIYNVRRDEWTLMGDLQHARQGGRIVTVMNGGWRRLFMVGGYEGSMDGSIHRNLDNLEELDIDCDDKSQSKWTLSDIKYKMEHDRSFFGAVAVTKSKFCNLEDAENLAEEMDMDIDIFDMDMAEEMDMDMDYDFYDD